MHKCRGAQDVRERPCHEGRVAVASAAIIRKQVEGRYPLVQRLRASEA